MGGGGGLNGPMPILELRLLLRLLANKPLNSKQGKIKLWNPQHCNSHERRSRCSFSSLWGHIIVFRWYVFLLLCKLSHIHVWLHSNQRGVWNLHFFKELLGRNSQALNFDSWRTGTTEVTAWLFWLCMRGTDSPNTRGWVWFALSAAERLLYNVLLWSNMNQIFSSVGFNFLLGSCFCFCLARFIFFLFHLIFFLIDVLISMLSLLWWNRSCILHVLSHHRRGCRAKSEAGIQKSDMYVHPFEILSNVLRVRLSRAYLYQMP